MKKTLAITMKILIVCLVLGWIILIFAESKRYKNEEAMIVVLKEETLTYDDGRVYVYYGLGYKRIKYARKSINGSEFGPIFIKVKDEVPKGK